MKQLQCCLLHFFVFFLFSFISIKNLSSISISPLNINPIFIEFKFSVRIVSKNSMINLLDITNIDVVLIIINSMFSISFVGLKQHKTIKNYIFLVIYLKFYKLQLGRIPQASGMHKFILFRMIWD